MTCTIANQKSWPWKPLLGKNLPTQGMRQAPISSGLGLSNGVLFLEQRMELDKFCFAFSSFLDLSLVWWIFTDVVFRFWSFSLLLFSFIGFYLNIPFKFFDITQGQKARLLSPVISSGSARCLQFYYYMGGTFVGELIVYTQKNALWQLIGDQGPVWKKGVIPLNIKEKTFQVCDL